MSQFNKFKYLNNTWLSRKVQRWSFSRFLQHSWANLDRSFGLEMANSTTVMVVTKKLCFMMHLSIIFRVALRFPIFDFQNDQEFF